MGSSRVHPCWHMRHLVPQLAEGTLTGFLRKYTLFHLQQCTQCQEALEALRKVIDRVRGARLSHHTLSSDRWEALEQAWDAAEDERAPPGS